MTLGWRIRTPEEGATEPVLRRWIKLLFGDWLPHDDLRREGFLDLDAMVEHRIFDEGSLNRTVGHFF